MSVLKKQLLEAKWIIKVYLIEKPATWLHLSLTRKCGTLPSNTASYKVQNRQWLFRDFMYHYQWKMKLQGL